MHVMSTVCVHGSVFMCSACALGWVCYVLCMCTQLGTLCALCVHWARYVMCTVCALGWVGYVLCVCTRLGRLCALCVHSAAYVMCTV